MHSNLAGVVVPWGFEDGGAGKMDATIFAKMVCLPKYTAVPYPDTVPSSLDMGPSATTPRSQIHTKRTCLFSVIAHVSRVLVDDFLLLPNGFDHVYLAYYYYNYISSPRQ